MKKHLNQLILSKSHTIVVSRQWSALKYTWKLKRIFVQYPISIQQHYDVQQGVSTIPSNLVFNMQNIKHFPVKSYRQMVIFALSQTLLIEPCMQFRKYAIMVNERPVLILYVSNWFWFWITKSWLYTQLRDPIKRFNLSLNGIIDHHANVRCWMCLPLNAVNMVFSSFIFE